MQNRFDIYAVIHKGLRAFMSHALTRVGRTDCEDTDERAGALKEVRELLVACSAHLHHEDQFIHPAMEARRPGSTAQTEGDHRGHERAIEDLGCLVGRVESSANGAREQAGEELYRALAHFVAENFEHMAIEERYNNAVLWACYSDAEIIAIEERLVAAVKPETMRLLLPWMLPNVSPGQRAALLGGMRQGMPREVFDGVINMLRDLLMPREWIKLRSALDLA